MLMAWYILYYNILLLLLFVIILKFDFKQAFWYTSSKGDYNGPVFGSSDKWTGLGVFFDSFDNDGKHNNPYIMGVVNDGSQVFDHAK